METTRRKNTAGAWLRGEVLRRITLAGVLGMAVVGFGLGYIVRGLLPLSDVAGGLGSWVVAGVTVLAFGAFYAYCHRVEATWGRGLQAEREVGDLIEHAVAQPGCAFAHDVKEALGAAGNVDHVVMTPAGVWVVETKAAWLSKRKFPAALRQVAENVGRVRRHLGTSLPVRAALVIAERSNDAHEADHDWNGEPVKAFGAKAFWRVLRAERAQVCERGESSETKRVERRVWALGSTRHLDT